MPIEHSTDEDQEPTHPANKMWEVAGDYTHYYASRAGGVVEACRHHEHLPVLVSQPDESE